MPVLHVLRLFLAPVNIPCCMIVREATAYTHVVGSSSMWFKLSTAAAAEVWAAFLGIVWHRILLQRSCRIVMWEGFWPLRPSVVGEVEQQLGSNSGNKACQPP